MESFYKIGKEISDKVFHHKYDRYYPRFLDPLRDKEFNMLEIGIDTTRAPMLWKKYFPKAFIYGAEIAKKVVDDTNQVYSEKDKVKAILCDQSKTEDLDNLVSTISECDFIIDDGSHISNHQFNTFVKLFSELLNDGGVYIIEDIETSYWHPEAISYGYKTGKINIVEEMARFLHSINTEFSGQPNPLYVSSITYGHNCIIITKCTKEEKELMDRPYRFRSNLPFDNPNRTKSS